MTVLLLDDLTSELSDKTVHSVVHGVVQLEELAPDYGAERRRLRVSKYRGQAFRGGYHNFAIRTERSRSFRALLPRSIAPDFQGIRVTGGIPELDMLLGGGSEKGSSTSFWDQREAERAR